MRFAKNGVCCDAALIFRHMSEGHDAGDISDPPHFIGRTTVFVHLHLPVIAQSNTSAFEAEVPGTRGASGCGNDDVGRHLSAVIKFNHALVAGAVCRASAHAQTDIDSGLRPDVSCVCRDEMPSGFPSAPRVNPIPAGTGIGSRSTITSRWA